MLSNIRPTNSVSKLEKFRCERICSALRLFKRDGESTKDCSESSLGDGFNGVDAGDNSTVGSWRFAFIR